jgi:hypothetical protein
MGTDELFQGAEHSLAGRKWIEPFCRNIGKWRLCCEYEQIVMGVLGTLAIFFSQSAMSPLTT